MERAPSAEETGYADSSSEKNTRLFPFSIYLAAVLE